MSATKSATVSIAGTDYILSTPSLGLLRLCDAAREIVQAKYEALKAKPLSLISDPEAFKAMCVLIAATIIKWDPNKNDADNAAALESQAIFLQAQLNALPGMDGVEQLSAATTAARLVTYGDKIEKKALPDQDQAATAA